MLFGQWDISVVIAVSTYSAFSSSMLIVNKYCMIYIPAPSLISLIQLVSCSGVIIIGQGIGLLHTGTPERMIQLQKILSDVLR